jgi:hypothetical protein
MEGRLQREPARTNRRSHARRRVAAVAALACLVALIASAHAGAAVTIGQVAPGPILPDCTSSNVDYLEPSVTGGTLYVARQAGTITSWTTNSSGAGAHYVIKVFRRTTDPDVFEVVAHSSSVLLAAGINTVPVTLPVKSGDLLGLNESGPANSCTFRMPGDNVLSRAGSLSDGSSGTFGPVNGVRLNVSAVVVPDNGFTLGAITHDRKGGTATVNLTTSNPGLVTMSGKGLRKRVPRNLAVAGPVSFRLVPMGRTARRLTRKGRVTVPITLTFFPTGGDPSVQVIPVKLRRIKRLPAPV